MISAYSFSAPTACTTVPVAGTGTLLDGDFVPQPARTPEIRDKKTINDAHFFMVICFIQYPQNIYMRMISMYACNMYLEKGICQEPGDFMHRIVQILSLIHI